MIFFEFIEDGDTLHAWINPNAIAFASNTEEGVRVDFLNGHSRVATKDSWGAVLKRLELP